MAANSLYPAFVVADYHSAFGFHKATWPTLAWNPALGTNGFGGYWAHDTVTEVDAQDMIEALATALAEFLHTTGAFTAATIYTMAAPNGAPAVPQAIIPLTIPGTNTSTAQAKAVQQTWTFRTSEFGQSRIVLLDAPIGANFDKLFLADFGAEDLALTALWTAFTLAWAGRDGAVPSTPIAKVFDLNDKLRREYGMT